MRFFGRRKAKTGGREAGIDSEVQWAEEEKERSGEKGGGVIKNNWGNQIWRRSSWRAIDWDEKEQLERTLEIHRIEY